jgi:hypothetical protein
MRVILQWEMRFINGSTARWGAEGDYTGKRKERPAPEGRLYNAKGKFPNPE